MIINGYVIQNVDGKSLTSGEAHEYVWYPHESLDKAWVHPKDTLENVLWGLDGAEPGNEATKLIEASHDTETGQTVTGKEIDIAGLDSFAVMDILRGQEN
jgi:hypothetical protein